MAELAAVLGATLGTTVGTTAATGGATAGAAAAGGAAASAAAPSLGAALASSAFTGAIEAAVPAALSLGVQKATAPKQKGAADPAVAAKRARDAELDRQIERRGKPGTALSARRSGAPRSTRATALGSGV